MAHYRPWLIPARLLMACAMITLIATTAIAAPGPLKGESATTESTEPDRDERSATATAEPDSGPAASEGRLEFRAPGVSSSASDATSHRSSVGSRTADGSESSHPGDVQPAKAAPEIEPRQKADQTPRDVEFASRPYVIVESGRPRHSTDSVLAYDGDETTSWSAGTAGPQAYAWFDLGGVRPVSGLRWYQTVVDGPVAIQVSNDRETWETVVIEEAPEADRWQRAVVARQARYVRIVVSNQNRTPDLAEVQIFGPAGSEPEPERDDPARTERATTENRPPHVEVTGGGEQGRQSAEEVVVTTPVPDSQAVEITVNGRRATCKGGDRCRVETPRPDIVEDCGDGTTTCTIRVGMSGGVAVCDSSGGTRGRTGRETRNGGTCTADASGGTVEIGEINR